jgi:hypothetical protein
MRIKDLTWKSFENMVLHVVFHATKAHFPNNIKCSPALTFSWDVKLGSFGQLILFT